MSTKRKDNKNRLLRNGESQRQDGRYPYKYYDKNGCAHFVYSWKLEPTDKVPAGKRNDLSLREKEKLIQRDAFDGIDYTGGNITILKQVEKYISIKIGNAKSTKQNYMTALALLKKDPIGAVRIKDVKQSDAKIWFVELQNNGRKYGTIENIKNIIKPAFDLAIADDCIRKNPFDFILKSVLKYDSSERVALTEDQKDAFLHYIGTHPAYKKYYDAIYILFQTGLRISELCGLILSDINFEDKTITVNRQIQRDSDWNYYIAPPKGSKENHIKTRKIPMSDEVIACFKKVISERGSVKIEPMIDGVVGFIFLTTRKTPTDKGTWESRFKRIYNSYNEANAAQLPLVTPHTCRHTFCTDMALRGMNPKTLQHIMGHADIVVTLRVYTHLQTKDISSEYWRVANRVTGQK